MIRLGAAAVVTLFVASAAAHGVDTQPKPWSLKLTWGQTIPGGTVYTVTLDDTGALTAERRGMPSEQGPTVVRHQATLAADAVAGIHSAAARLNRRFNPRKAKGSVLADGGFMSLEILEGTALSRLGVGRLAHRDEAGEDWVALVSAVEKTLPDGFIE